MLRPRLLRAKMKSRGLLPRLFIFFPSHELLSYMIVISLHIACKFLRGKAAQYGPALEWLRECFPGPPVFNQKTLAFLGDFIRFAKQ